MRTPRQPVEELAVKDASRKEVRCPFFAIWQVPQSIIASPLALTLDSMRIKFLNEMRRARANGGPWIREYDDGEHLYYVQCSAVAQCFTGHPEELVYREEARTNRERISCEKKSPLANTASGPEIADEWLTWAIQLARQVVAADRRGAGIPEYVEEKMSVATAEIARHLGANAFTLRERLQNSLRVSRRRAIKRCMRFLVDTNVPASPPSSENSIFGADGATGRRSAGGRLAVCCDEYALREYLMADSLYRLRWDLHSLNTGWAEAETINLALKGYGQTEIGLALGVSQPTVSKYLGGLISEAA